MTTIAWDGQTLAADKQATYASTPVEVTKIFKAFRKEDGEQLLYGCSGLRGEGIAFRKWVEEGGPKPELSELSVLAIDSKKRLWVCSHKLFWEEVKAKKWAIGTGGDYALGAMYAGKSAEEAVRIAIQLDINSGIGVDILTLSSNKGRRIRNERRAS